MSGLPLQIPKETAPAAEFISIEEAAKRSGRSIGHLSRRCRDHWGPLGLARLGQSGSGKPSWQIDIAADAAFAAVKFPEQIEFDARTLDEEQRRELFARKKILDDWLKARAAGVPLGFTEPQITGQFITHLQCSTDRKISRATLFRWHDAYRAEGLAGLVDRRWQKESAAGSDSLFLECVKGYYLSTNQPSAKACHVAASFKAREMGWRVLGYRATCLYLAALPQALLVKRREGGDAFVLKCEPSIERDYSTLHSNEEWVGDHHQFDVIVSHQGKLVRPWLTAWMDMRSRKIVGWCVFAHDPNSNTIISALKRGILSHGVPEGVTIDNGKDFSAWVLHGSTKWQRRKGKVNLEAGRVEGILNHLGTKASFVLKYHGQSKVIERGFGTAADQFCRSWPTYCGNSPSDRPEELERRLAAGEAPTLEEFTAQFEQWLDRAYHATPHAGDAMHGRSPAQVFDESWNGHAKRVASADLLDLLLTRQTRPVRVHKNGVTYSGINYGQFEPTLIAYLGKQVYLRVDECINEVQIWSEDDQFICLAGANQRLPANATHAELSAALREKKNHRKTLRTFYAKRARLTEDLPDLMIRARAADATARAPSNPRATPEQPSLKPVRSEFETQLPAVRRAFEMQPARRATGTDAAPTRFVYIPSNPSSGEEDFE
jgi:hypothetical protein